jgi:acyl dehydratase
MADGLKNRSAVRIVVIASLGWNWRFKGPILAGDRIGVHVAVQGKRPNSKADRGLLTLGFTVRNQRGEIVQEGETTLITPLQPAVPTPA